MSEQKHAADVLETGVYGRGPLRVVLAGEVDRGAPYPNERYLMAGEFFVASVYRHGLFPGDAEGDRAAEFFAAAPKTAAERDRLREVNRDLLDLLREVMVRGEEAHAPSCWCADDHPAAVATKVGGKCFPCRARAAITKAEGTT